MSASPLSSQNEITGHYGHPQHKAVLEKNNVMLQNCEDCKARIFGLGSCYKCNHCNKYFHGACLNAKEIEKPYPFSPNFPLKLSTEKTDKLCSACCAFIRGIMYTGSDYANMDYQFHPQCLELSPKLECLFEYEGMNLKLELEGLPKMPRETTCVVCETQGGMGWCYSIKSNGEFKFACHVRCLKERLALKWLDTKVPDEMPELNEYLKNLYRKDLKMFKNMFGELALEALAVGFDLMISAFAGAPFASIISATFGVLVRFAR